ncbi:Arylsulfatase precursor [Crateriforma conspicua]|uniref:Arylsulfatase n=1 Tax=Crateriforma conspicua TaxID=2527996 RepID=A0A5C6FN09_9PLAN|nr:Arylsulfatase precursor [Crateriforma conspicua]
MLIDDLGAEAVGCYGGESYSTPNIDALAERGMRYDNAFSMPARMVSRATMLTGRYAFRSNLPFNDTPLVRRDSWGRGEITFGNLLADAGYVTGISGKWQLCEHEKYPDHLSDLGFDHQNAWAW